MNKEFIPIYSNFGFLNSDSCFSQVEDVLASLSIPHRTMLIESKVWDKVAAWAEGAPPPQPPPSRPDNDDTASG